MAKAWPFGEWSPIVCQPIVSQIYQRWYQGNQCRCYWLGVVLPQASQVHSHNKVCARLFLVCLQLSMFRPASDPHILFRTYSTPQAFLMPEKTQFHGNHSKDLGATLVPRMHIIWGHQCFLIKLSSDGGTYLWELRGRGSSQKSLHTCVDILPFLFLYNPESSQVWKRGEQSENLLLLLLLRQGLTV